ncbi:phage terminase small subunit-related protein [Sediminibacillus sp. JSM 1682029]|uniref:phage terminase small subunit-related protein n=1 Tax=Sediminibacillus sp. JSM 1682029 TaxID=3229857 RepID=UPI003523CE92
MARKRNPNRHKAFELFKEHGGNITNREIAKQLNVLEKTISAWKSRDKWNERTGVKNQSSTSKKRSTTKNKNARTKKQQEVIDALVEAGTYSPALDLLIEIYLDAYEEYQESKTEKLRKELAKYLGQLGLDGKNKDLIKQSGTLLAKGESEEPKAEKDSEPEENNKLIQFRQRMNR